jgi:membrane-associated phospholipid phosphatase
MKHLASDWPLGLNTKRWRVSVAVFLFLLAIALAVDRPASVYAQSWPRWVIELAREVTGFGDSGWILIPTAALFVLTAPLALLVRWPLMRLVLKQFSSLYAFIFLGVGVPSLTSAILSRLIGRGRPVVFEQFGDLHFQMNLSDWTFESFPSGHTTTAFALAATIGFLSARWYVPMLVLAAAVGLSRLILGAHYPSDILAGAVIGLVGAFAVRRFFADRGWLFGRDSARAISMRPIASLTRYLSLKRREIAPGPRRNRP